MTPRLPLRRASPALACALLAALVAACGPARVTDLPDNHMEAPDEDSAADDSREIPEPVDGAPRLEPPEPSEPEETYDVVVDRVPAEELLFALARDADIEIDILGDIDGRVTLNARDATLPRLLERIALQAPIRYELHDGYLQIMADEPYIDTYAVPYVNISRDSSSSVDTATQIESTGFSEDGDGGGRGSNNSSTSLENQSDNRFWETLEDNLGRLLHVDVDTDGDLPDNGRGVMMNREAGYVTVRATQRQHDEVREYLDQVVASARRQVLIEATVVEVTLSDRHQSGVDWSLLADSASGLDIVQNMSGSALGGAFNVQDPPGSGSESLTIGYSDPDASDGDLQSTIKALDQFGDVRVMSSPKIIALNNQLAILKVVDNRVYFTVDVQQTQTDDFTNTTFETEVNTVPIGLVMTVTPYVGDGEEVLLNVRPTVSRILGFVNDPNPELAQAGVENEIPEIQVREMESMLRVDSQQIAVLGGLMQDTLDQDRRSVPGLGNLPLIGRLFSYRDDRTEKTELIIFMRPTVIDEASLAGDFRRFGQYLPGREDERKPGDGVRRIERTGTEPREDAR